MNRLQSASHSGRLAEDFSPGRRFGSSLVAWWEPRWGDMTVAGGVVSQLNDLSGNANHLTEATNKPAWDDDGGPNGRGMLQFDGTNDILSKTSGFSLGASPYTMWSVVRADTWADKPVVFIVYGAYTRFYYLRMVTGPDAWSHATDGGGSLKSSSTVTGATVGGWRLVRCFMDDANDLQGISVNNGSDATTADTAAVPGLERLYLGGDGGSGFSAMSFAGAWIINRKYTAADAAASLNYANARWALGL